MLSISRKRKELKWKAINQQLTLQRSTDFNTRIHLLITRTVSLQETKTNKQNPSQQLLQTYVLSVPPSATELSISSEQRNSLEVLQSAT